MPLSFDASTYPDYAEFHHSILLEPLKAANPLDYFLKPFGWSGQDHQKFILAVINPALQHIDARGLDKSMKELLLRALRLNLQRGCSENNIDLLQSFASTPPNTKRLETVRAFALLLDSIGKPNKGIDSVLENWAASLCPGQGCHPLFIAHEILCACLFQIQQQGPANFKRQCATRAELRKTRGNARLQQLYNTVHKRIAEANNRQNCTLYGYQSRAQKYELDGLKDMLTRLQQDTDPLADRVYAAVLAKQYYLKKEGVFGKPSSGEPSSGEVGNGEALLAALHQEYTSLDASGTVKPKAEKAISQLAALVAENAPLCILKSREQSHVRRRSQYGQDFYQRVESHKPQVLEKFNGAQHDPLAICLDSWLTMPLRGRYDRHQGDRITYNKMLRLQCLSISNGIPVIAEIAQETLKK